MITLVPVSRFRITYEVAAGRPFSRLEQLILRALQEGATDLAQLGDIFQVHHRLLIEALVTLTHAGWLAVGSGGEGFVLTSEGREAAAANAPPSTIVVTSRRAHVVMERVTGGLVSNDEVRFVMKRDLKGVWDESVRLRPDVSDNRLDEGQVQHLLQRRQGEWVRWIGPIDMVSKDNHWLPVNVDIESGSIVGLPDAWLARLRPTIVEAVWSRAASMTLEERSHSWNVPTQRRAESRDPAALHAPLPDWPVTLSEDDLCLTAEDHERWLAEALREAQGCVLVASAFASTRKLELLRPSLKDALGRGVSIDMLWGYMADGSAEGRETIDWLRKLAYDAKHDGLRGVIRFNQVPSGSHAKLIVWDKGNGARACLGSYNWLSASPNARSDSSSTNVSIRLSEPGVVAALARCAAALWSGAAPEILTSAADRWRRIASDLDKQASTQRESSPTNATVRLVLDREHEAILREWMRTAQQRILVGSHRLGVAGEPRLASADVDRAGEVSFDVIYGLADTDDEGLGRMAALIKRSRGTLKHLPGFHAKALVSDASCCITSYNFLSADPFGTSKRTRELGVVIDGAPAEWLWSALHALSAGE